MPRSGALSHNIIDFCAWLRAEFGFIVGHEQARDALRAGGGAPAILNAANEIAVAAFLDGRIRFTQIPELIAEALARVPGHALDSIDTCVEVDARTRATVRDWLPGGVAAGIR